jgi:hypothetical protein
MFDQGTGKCSISPTIQSSIHSQPNNDIEGGMSSLTDETLIDDVLTK